MRQWLHLRVSVCVCVQVKEHQARIAKLSCDISVLQGVISHLDRELKVLHQSQRWSAQLTDLKVAK